MLQLGSSWARPAVDGCSSAPEFPGGGVAREGSCPPPVTLFQQLFTYDDYVQLSKSSLKKATKKKKKKKESNNPDQLRKEKVPKH